MTKVVYNNEYGGFHLTDEEIVILKEGNGIAAEKYVSPYSLDYNEGDEYFEIPRHNDVLVSIAEARIKKQGSKVCELSIRDIGDATRYHLHEYDGLEYPELEHEIDWTYVKGGPDERANDDRKTP